MMKKSKKLWSILALLLVAALCIPMMTQEVSAAADSGTCGDNLTWTLTEDGTLTISGTGDMTAWYNHTSVPWSGYVDAITQVVIEEGVTGIGYNAFYNCTSLTEVTIPDSVTDIGGAVFDGCSSLTAVTIPDSVTGIGSYAFSNCTSLTEINIPKGVTNIGSHAFEKCTGLTKVTIPEGVTNIVSHAFYKCTSLTEVTIPEGVTDIGGFVFYCCSSLTAVTIPDGVTSIGEYAFDNCTSLTEVTIPDGVTSIGSSAFYNCTSLTEVNIPDSVTTIGDLAFSNCYALSSITVPGSVTDMGQFVFSECSNLTDVTLTSGLTTIGKSMFFGCRKLTNVVIPAGVTEIGSQAFYNTGLTGIVLPEGIISVGDRAFVLCNSLTSVSIPASLTSLGDKALADCDALVRIQVDEKNQHYTTDASGVLYNKAKTELITAPVSLSGSYTVPDGVVTINDYAFDMCKQLLAVALPDSLTSIGNRAFSSCNGLTDLTVPKNVTSVGSYFVDSTDISKIEFLGNAPAFDSQAFSTIRGKIYYNGSNPTWTADVMQQYGGTVSWLGVGTCGDGVTWVRTPEGELIISGAGNMADYTADNPAPWYAVRDQITHVTVEPGVTGIGSYAFYGLEDLTGIAFEGNAPTFADTAFQDVTVTAVYPGYLATWTGDVLQQYGGTVTWQADLPEITAEGTCGEDLTWTLLANGTLVISGTGDMDVWNYGGAPWYSYGSSITRVMIEDGATDIGNNAFLYCRKLSEIIIPDTVTRIGTSAFEQCSALSNIIIPENTAYIGEEAFAHSGLTTLFIPAGVAQMHDNALTSTSKLTEIRVDEENQHFLTDASGVLFDADMAKLYRAPVSLMGSYSVPDTVVQLMPNSFYNCKGLTELTLQEGITEIPALAFSYCEGLTHLTIPSTVKTLGYGAFTGSNSLESIAFTGDAPTFNDYAFTDWTGTCTYPCGNETWTEDVLQQYKGTVTWATEGHSYVDGICPGCAAQEVPVIGANMSLGNELTMNFFVNKADIPSGQDYYIQVTKTYADGRDDVTVKYPFADWMDEYGDYYGVKFSSVAAKEMADPIYVQVFHSDGTPASAVWTDSVRDYAMRMYDSAEDNEKSVYVDMLNYGAAAQNYFSYGTNDLASSQLTAEHQAYATKTVEYTNSRVSGENYYGTNLNLGSNIALNMYFQNISSDMYAIASYTDHYGNEKAVRIEGSVFKPHKPSVNGYRISINTLAVADMRQSVTCTVYTADGTVVASCTDSVESYIARMSNTGALYDTIMRFATSAYSFFHQ